MDPHSPDKAPAGNLALGANIVIIFPLRFLMAFLITRSFAAWLDRSEARKAAT